VRAALFPERIIPFPDDLRAVGLKRHLQESRMVLRSQICSSLFHLLVPLPLLLLPACNGDGVEWAMAEETRFAIAVPAERRPRYLDPEHAPLGPGWRRLFNEKDLTGWHARDPNVGMSWRVEDGLLRNTSDLSKHDGVDLISDEQFRDFEIYYEYRVPKGSNSGLYLRGRYEIQILDSLGKPAGNGQNGAIYSLMAPSRNVSREANQWQSVYATMIGNTINVWLNGEKVIDTLEPSRATGDELDQNYDLPGPILLQGNHGSVDFRNLFIRTIERR
jgi:hypothetical protein